MRIQVALLFLTCMSSGFTDGTHGVSSVSGTIRRPVFHKCNWCAENALCVANSYCRCLSSSYWGNPYFLCYKPTDVDICELCDDPVLTTENKENTSLSYFSSTLMMDKVVSRGRLLGTCRIRAVVTSFRLLGKSFPRCVLVRTDLRRPTGQITCTFVYKICGYSRPDGTLRWQIFSGVVGKDGRIRYTTWKTLLSSSTRACPHTYCHCPTYFQVSRGKILIMRISCCYVKLGFRPFIKRIEWLKSGIFILTTKTKPPFSPLPGYFKNFNICLRPGISLSDLKNKFGLSEHHHAISYLALTNMPQDLITISPEQTAMSSSLLKCSADKLQKFFDDADFMLTSHPFIKEICGTKPGFSEIMKLVKYAADWYCQGISHSCQSILALIRARAKGLLSRPKKFAKLVRFVALNCKNS